MIAIPASFDLAASAANRAPPRRRQAAMHPGCWHRVSGKNLLALACIMGFYAIGTAGQAVGCAGFGQLAGTEDQLDEGSCEKSRPPPIQAALPKASY